MATENSELDKVVEDLSGDWCDDCQHPRCVENKKSVKRQLQALIDKAVIEELVALKKDNGTWLRDRIVKRLKQLRQS